MEIGKGYTSVEWREDLKKILRRSAEGDAHAVFLFTGTQPHHHAHMHTCTHAHMHTYTHAHMQTYT